jgi:hypothetical protein
MLRHDEGRILETPPLCDGDVLPGPDRLRASPSPPLSWAGRPPDTFDAFGADVTSDAAAALIGHHHESHCNHQCCDRHRWPRSLWCNRRADFLPNSFANRRRDHRSDTHCNACCADVDARHATCRAANPHRPVCAKPHGVRLASELRGTREQLQRGSQFHRGSHIQHGARRSLSRSTHPRRRTRRSSCCVGIPFLRPEFRLVRTPTATCVTLRFYRHRR